MIIKGGSRGRSPAARQGTSNARTPTSTSKSCNSTRSTGNLNGALRDWQFISTGTRGSKGLYHANIDPDARYTMTADQWKIAVDRLEKELGFDGQPRAVVMHEKHGRGAYPCGPAAHQYRHDDDGSRQLQLCGSRAGKPGARE